MKYPKTVPVLHPENVIQNRYYDYDCGFRNCLLVWFKSTFENCTEYERLQLRLADRMFSAAAGYNYLTLDPTSIVQINDHHSMNPTKLAKVWNEFVEELGYDVANAT